MSSKIVKLGVLAASATAALALAALAGGGTGRVGSGTASAAKSVCGLGNGKKATLSPIKLGAIATKQPGTDFTDIPNMAKAYFDCVNANGGIYGHPIQYIIQTEQTDPGQVAALARKLVETDKVVGLVGNTSIIDCSVNHKYYESKGLYVIASGIAPECYGRGDTNIASVNMGPRYSSDGAVQYVIRAGVDKVVFDQSNVPGTGYIFAGPAHVAKAAHVPIVGFTDTVPIQDANSVALKLVQAAGPSGGVVLNFTPDQALLILQAVQKQGLTNRVKAWGCSTPCNSDFVAQALGTAWDGIFGVNAELNLPSASGPDSALYRQLAKKAKLAFGLGSFSQMGFVEARIATAALLNMKPPYTLGRVNQAFVGVRNFRTDILCSPWYFGKVTTHIPNNTDRTVTPDHGKMVVKEPCFKISAADPDIAAARTVEKKNPQLTSGAPYPLKGSGK
ncbi:MAG TPA: ABC transporter substrate-binding protein [Gaiellaceae bacterium]|nr:ABC transporter substrate-binding protein [Gaiellaceae bacterium]